MSEIYTASIFRIAVTVATICSGHTGNVTCHFHPEDVPAKYLQHIPHGAIIQCRTDITKKTYYYQSELKDNHVIAVR